jgi:hypothetical protein
MGIFALALTGAIGHCSAEPGARYARACSPGGATVDPGLGRGYARLQAYVGCFWKSAHLRSSCAAHRGRTPLPAVRQHTFGGVSNDGLVYVCDRGSSRFQVVTVDGRYVTQVFLSRDKASREKSARQALENRATEMAFGRPLTVVYEELEKGAEGGQTASRVAFSPDPNSVICT